MAQRQVASVRYPVFDVRLQSGVREAIDQMGFATRYFPNYLNRSLRLHSVNVVLMSFIVRGHGWHHLGDDVYEEWGGSVGITHYGQIHDIVTDADGMEVVNVYLDLERHPIPPLPRELQVAIPEILPLHPAFQNKMNKMVRIPFDDGGSEAASNLFAIERENQARMAGWMEAARMHFTLFLMNCCRQALRTGVVACAPAGIGGIDAMERVRRHIDANFTKPLRLKDLASMAKMSDVHLCRSFKRHTGKTVFGYLVQRRIQDAMVRLRCGDDKISAIAVDCGFNDLSYFNRTFHRLVGRTPSRYRCPEGDRRNQ